MRPKTYYKILFVTICCSYSMNFIKFVFKEFLRYSNIFEHVLFYRSFQIGSWFSMFNRNARRQLRREYWCKLSTSAESLLLVFWLTSSVDYTATTLVLIIQPPPYFQGFLLYFPVKIFFLGVLPQASWTLKLRCWISFSFQSLGIQIVWQQIFQLFYPNCFIFCYINLYVTRFIVFFDVLVLLNLIIGGYSYDVLIECTLDCFIRMTCWLSAHWIVFFVLLIPFFKFQAATLDSSWKFIKLKFNMSTTMKTCSKRTLMWRTTSSSSGSSSSSLV